MATVQAQLFEDLHREAIRVAQVSPKLEDLGVERGVPMLRDVNARGSGKPGRIFLGGRPIVKEQQRIMRRRRLFQTAAPWLSTATALDPFLTPVLADTAVDGRGGLFEDDLIAQLEATWALERQIRGTVVQDILSATWVLDHQFTVAHDGHG